MTIESRALIPASRRFLIFLIPQPAAPSLDVILGHIAMRFDGLSGSFGSFVLNFFVSRRQQESRDRTSAC
jgi:hypothetical protein